MDIERSEMELSDLELERYSRQLVVPELGIEGQLKIKDSCIMVVGAGALGTVVCGYLAAAGVGRLGIVDPDRVELSNLQRQFLHFPPDIGQNKAEALSEKLGLLNPEIVVEQYPARLEEDNAKALVNGSDVVVDCSDNFDTRYLLNKICIEAGIPLIESGVSGMTGLVTTIIPGEGPCYMCIFPDRPDVDETADCEEAGVIGPAAGVVASIQALEAIKVATGIGDTLTGRVLQVSGLDMSVTTVRADRVEDCKVCAG